MDSIWPPMPPDEFKLKMLELYPLGGPGDDVPARDIEEAHAAADNLMCDMLRSLGYGDGVDVYRAVHKRYT